MRKIFLSMAAAILTVTSLSSFRTSQHSLFYFIIRAIIKILVGSAVVPSQVTYSGTSAPVSPTCPAVVVNHYYCVIAVTINQVTQVNFTHLKASVPPADLQTINTRTTIN